MQQRSVWAQIIVFPIVAVGYFTVVLTRAATSPIDEVSWVVPLMWALGITVAGIIVTTILAAIGHGVVASARGEEPEFEEGDVRDKEIEREGDSRAHSLTGLGGLAVIILAMLRVDHFWIANAMYLSGVLAGLYGGWLKIRMYRRGF